METGLIFASIRVPISPAYTFWMIAVETEVKFRITDADELSRRDRVPDFKKRDQLLGPHGTEIRIHRNQ